MPSTVTREQAEAVLAAVKEKFSAYCVTFAKDPVTGEPDYDRVIPETHPAELPQLVENWQSSSGAAQWAIVWETGPYDWAIRPLEWEDVNEELTCAVQDVAPGRVVKDKAVKLPAGVHVEAYCSYVLTIHPAN